MTDNKLHHSDQNEQDRRLNVIDHRRDRTNQNSFINSTFLVLQKDEGDGNEQKENVKGKNINKPYVCILCFAAFILLCDRKAALLQSFKRRAKLVDIVKGYPGDGFGSREEAVELQLERDRVSVIGQ
ncbi:hypothetical protein D3C81_1525750 [compost metagenome]